MQMSLPRSHPFRLIMQVVVVATRTAIRFFFRPTHQHSHSLHNFFTKHFKRGYKSYRKQ